jgi:hypothetical protein
LLSFPHLFSRINRSAVKLMFPFVISARGFSTGWVVS